MGAKHHRQVITGVDTITVESAADPTRWLVVPSRLWKGNVADAFWIYSGPGDCHVLFQIDREYLIYALAIPSEAEWLPNARWPDGTVFPIMVTGICSRTRPIGQAGGDLLALGPPTWPR